MTLKEYSLFIPPSQLPLKFFAGWKCQCESLASSGQRSIVDDDDDDWFRPKAPGLLVKKDVFLAKVVRQLSLLFCFRNRHHFYCCYFHFCLQLKVKLQVFTAKSRQAGRQEFWFACRDAARWHNHRCLSAGHWNWLSNNDLMSFIWMRRTWWLHSLTLSLYWQFSRTELLGFIWSVNEMLKAFPCF